MYFLIITLSLTTSVLLIILKKKSTHIRSLQREVNTIFDRIIIMKFDLDGKILDVSDAYGNIFGYDKYDLIGQTIDKEHMSPSRIDKPIWQILKDEGEFYGEMQLFTSKNEPYWMYKQIIKDYDLSNQHRGYISISKDITADKAFQEQQRQLVDQSRHAIMGEMITMIAHQWKQPLATMSALASGMQLDIELNQLNANTLETQLTTMDEIIKHLAQTIGDFQNFFEKDKSVVDTNIKSLVNEALKLIAFKLNGVNILQSIDAEITVKLLKNELLQVLINIIANAADAVKGRIDPNIEITLSIDERQGCAMIIIADNGTGIDPSIVSKIFDPYFSTKSKNGTGLGLYICKTIIEKHLQGRLSVCNLDTGSQFTIHLPYEAASCA